VTAAPESSTVRYVPQGVHADFLRDRSFIRVAIGMAGSGKSIACCWDMFMSAMLVPSFRGLMLRQTQRSLSATTLVTFQKEVAQQAIKDGSCWWYGGSPKDPPAFRFSNGSSVTVAGCDTPEKFLSLSLDAVFIDEAIEVDLNTIETLTTRMRGIAPIRKKILLATNPSHPRHFIKQKIDSGEYSAHTSTHRDNPAYCMADGTYTAMGLSYLQKLETITGVRRERLLYGRWAAAEGTVYSGWNESYHVIGRSQLPEFGPQDPMFISVDFGYRNPMAVLWYRLHRATNRMYVVREFYRTGVLVEDLADVIRQVNATDFRGVPVWAIVCDHDAEGRATLEKHMGMPTRAASKAVRTGVEAVEARLRVREDGRPGLFVVRDAMISRDPVLDEAKKPCGLIEEIPGYVWAETTSGLKEEPVKKNDHAADSLRYGVMFLDASDPLKVHSPVNARPQRTPVLSRKVG
jgi:PBSX family phage terminase large subunit